MTDIQQAGIPFALESLWAIEPSAYERLRELVMGSSHERLAAAASLSAADTTDPGYENRGGVAVVPFTGVVAKRATIWSRIFGGRAVTTDTRSAITAAVADPTVKSILLVIDSPGGTVDGTADLADAVAAANLMKPVCAYAEDMCASAAYWVGSQAGRFVGNSTATVGSIGVFASVPDVSRLVKNLGIEVNVVKSASGKGAGTTGAPVTDAQLAEVQRMVDAIHVQFVAAVSKGRGKPMADLADGRMHIGQAAVDLGFLDAIEPLSATIQAMQVAAEPQIKEIIMTETVSTPVAPAPQPDPVPAVSTVDYSADIAKLTTELAALSAEAASLRAAKTTENLLDQARAERKLTPALVETAKTIAKHGGVDALKDFLSALPVSAPAAGSVSVPKVGEPSGIPTARHESDHVGVALHAYKSETAGTHQSAIEYMEKANAAGRKINYFDAVVAVTRR